MTDFASALSEMMKGADYNRSVTENGAVGLKTSGSALVDLNFSLSSMRNQPEEKIWANFLMAWNENPVLAAVWLFFARDIRGGCGERRVFRVIFPRFARERPDEAVRLLKLIPEYGRWDDLVDLFFTDVPKAVREAVRDVISGQLRLDTASMRAGKPVSLLAKWLPSENTSSANTRRRATAIRVALGMFAPQYRRTLSSLRAAIDVTERKMSANQWSDIRYSGVPSRAALNYRSAFRAHDGERYEAYLESVRSGDAVIHSGALFPHDIVHAYRTDIFHLHTIDDTLEAQWKALPNTVKPGCETLAVVDVSGSMRTLVGNTSIQCYEVAVALGLYFAERVSGPFRDSMILFSRSPRYIHIEPSMSLCSKLNMINEICEYSNTDIEKTFDLVLNTAVRNHLSQEELPANILIITDGEFDDMTVSSDDTLMDCIAAKYADAGYKLPRLVFWNVCSRTGTVPLAQNDMGVALVSGFSPNIADMVMSGSLDPFECLKEKLLSDRYKPVLDALKG